MCLPSIFELRITLKGRGRKVLARQLSAIEDRCSAHCKGAGQGAGNKVPSTYGGNA
jgi:hypothetical protein